MIDQSERVRDTLVTIDAPVCDDCLGSRAGVSPQDVGEACQRLADHGDVDREQGRCALCGRTKIVNSIVVQSYAAQET